MLSIYLQQEWKVREWNESPKWNLRTQWDQLCDKKSFQFCISGNWISDLTSLYITSLCHTGREFQPCWSHQQIPGWIYLGHDAPMCQGISRKSSAITSPSHSAAVPTSHPPAPVPGLVLLKYSGVKFLGKPSYWHLSLILPSIINPGVFCHLGFQNGIDCTF